MKVTFIIFFSVLFLCFPTFAQELERETGNEICTETDCEISYDEWRYVLDVEVDPRNENQMICLSHSWDHAKKTLEICIDVTGATVNEFESPGHKLQMCLDQQIQSFKKNVEKHQCLKS
ncbi:hypothetical protein [Litorimonas sp. WD9-15]|uniref:hypothetical protein n=1 Tax=Litorimonas sp. WD9-15 TaxID=3418716 RepID=UPI003D08080D